MGKPELLPEEWRAVPGFVGVEVSNAGRMRSWRIKGGRGGLGQAPALLVPRIDRGYRKVNLSPGGGDLSQRVLFVHLAVLAAFVGPRPDGMEGRHLSGDSNDNRLSNLTWGTKAENEADKIAHGTHRTGSRGMRRKLTPLDVGWIRERITAGDSFAELGRRYGVRWQSIQAIAKGKSWKN